MPSELEIRHRFYELKRDFYSYRERCTKLQLKHDCADSETCSSCHLSKKQEDAHANATLFWEEHKEIGLY